MATTKAIPGFFGYAVKPLPDGRMSWWAWRGFEDVPGRMGQVARWFGSQSGTADSLDAAERDIQARFGSFKGQAWRWGNNWFDIIQAASDYAARVRSGEIKPQKSQGSFGFAEGS